MMPFGKVGGEGTRLACGWCARKVTRERECCGRVFASEVVGGGSRHRSVDSFLKELGPSLRSALHVPPVIIAGGFSVR